MTTADDPTRLQDLVAEFIDRRLGGEALDVDAFCARHPELRERLRERLLTFERLGDFLAPAAAPFEPGEVVGDYKIEELLGRGGMGTVYRARQLSLDRTVALKVGREGGTLDPLLLREARAAARLRHEHVVGLLALERLRERPVLVLDYIDGESLAERLRRGVRDPVGAVLHAGALLARALAATHARGILHRDVKPANVLIARDGRPVLTDFGLARLEGEESLTVTRGDVGTPAYMSPEQVDGAEIGPASDLYALGATLYEWLAGRPPFAAPTRSAMYRQILTDAPPPLRAARSDAGADAQAIVARCLEKAPGDRYPDAAALAQDLERAAAGLPLVHANQGGRRRKVRRVLRRHARAVVIALVVLLLAGAAAWPWAQERRRARVEGLLLQAELALERARFPEAEALLASAAAIAGEDGRAAYLRTDARLQQLALHETPITPALMHDLLHGYERAAAEGFDTAGGRFARAYLCAILGRPEPAAELYRTGCELPHTTASDHFHRAGMEAFLGRPAQAAHWYAEAVRRHPSALFPYLRLAWFRALAGDTQEALSILDQCERIHPGSPVVAAVRGRLLASTPEGMDAGYDLLEDLCRRRPVAHLAVQYLSDLYRTCDHQSGIERLYADLVRDEPDQPRWRYLLAFVLLPRDLDAAEREIGELLRLCPGDLMAQGLLAVRDLRRGDARAAADKVRWIATQPGYPAVLLAVNAALRAPSAAEAEGWQEVLTAVEEGLLRSRVLVDS